VKSEDNSFNKFEISLQDSESAYIKVEFLEPLLKDIQEVGPQIESLIKDKKLDGLIMVCAH
jgi:hypothetical protein